MADILEQQDDEAGGDPSQQAKPLPGRGKTAERRGRYSAGDEGETGDAPPWSRRAQVPRSAGEEVFPQARQVEASAGEIDLKRKRSAHPAGQRRGVDQRRRQRSGGEFSFGPLHADQVPKTAGM